jgi:uncharacterized membrane protein
MQQLWSKVLWSQVCVLCLLAISFIPMETLWTQIGYGIFASIIVLYLPGYWISYILFSTDELSLFERFVMSCAISVACMTFFALYVDYFSTPLTSMGAIVSALFLVVGAWLWLVIIQKKTA